MSTKKTKYWYPKKQAELSFQVWRDANGTRNFTVTSNPADPCPDLTEGCDKYIFARNLIETNTVSFKELAWLCDFFNTVKSLMQEKLSKG